MMKRAATANAETKYSTHTMPTSASTTVDTTVVHSGIAQGTTRHTRIGDSVYARQLRVWGEIIRNSSATTLFSTVRLVIYTPRRGAANIINTLAMNEVIDREEYHVWGDRKFYVTPTNPVRPFSMSKSWTTKRIPGMKIQWKSGTGTDLEQNGIWIAMVGDEASYMPASYVTSRLYFKDP